MTARPRPLVSIIVPTYNQVGLIAATVSSLVEQSYPNVEVIVVDDGSIDGSADAVPVSERVEVVRQANQGVAAARNNGFARSRGEFVLFVDGDDQLLPTKVARDVELLSERASLGAAYCAWTFFGAEHPDGFGECHPRLEGMLLEDLLLKRVSPIPAAVTVRRSWLDRIGLFDPDCAAAGDYDLWVRLALAGAGFGYIDEALVKYRITDASMSSQFDKMEAAVSRVFDKAFADPAMPEATRALEGRARAILQLEIASECYRIGARNEGRNRIRNGLAQDPALAQDRDWFVEWLAAVALGPRVAHGDAGDDLVSAIIDDLPAEAGSRRALMRRFNAHRHVVATLLAGQRRDRSSALAHAVPAFWYRPRVLLNRGFVKILLRALAG